MHLTQLPKTENVTKLYLPGLGDVYFYLQPYAFTISEEHRPIYYFDADGRFIGGYFEGVHYKRGLQNDVLRKEIDAQKQKLLRFLTYDERKELIDHVQARVIRLRKALAGKPYEEILSRLDTILTWDFEQLEAQRATFQSLYKPISILPPDQYLSVVLQAAEGCSWNECTFCDFYRDRKFRIKSPDEFRAHAQAIRQFFGKSIGGRKSIFLADANALIIPQQRLLELLTIVREEFTIGAPKSDTEYGLNGIYSFLDIFGAEKKTLEQYRTLKEHQVKRIYIGLETGDDELFGLLNKPGSPRECIEAVQMIKAAGISVGVIIMAGVGGEQMAQQHIAQTTQAILEMPLEPEDIVYVSPLFPSEESEYARDMQQLGIRPLTMQELNAQVDHFKLALHILGKSRPRVTLYDIREFVY